MCTGRSVAVCIKQASSSAVHTGDVKQFEQVDVRIGVHTFRHVTVCTFKHVAFCTGRQEAVLYAQVDM